MSVINLRYHFKSSFIKIALGTLDKISKKYSQTSLDTLMNKILAFIGFFIAYVEYPRTEVQVWLPKSDEKETGL